MIGRLHWRGVLTGAAVLALVVAAVGVALDQRHAAKSWRDLEKHRAVVAAQRFDELHAELVSVRSHAEDLQAQLDVAAASGAKRGDRLAELTILAQRARNVRSRLSACLAGLSNPPTLRCQLAELDAQQLLDSLSRLTHG